MVFFTLRAVLRLVVFSFLRVHVREGWRLQQPGPLLLVGNHPTIVDGLVLSLLAPRKVRFIAAPELLRIPLVRGLLRWLGAIPAGEGAVERAVAALRQGDLVAIFPEGRTSGGVEVLPFHSGAERIALASGAPTVAFAVDGTQHVYPEGALWARPADVRLNFGAGFQREDVVALWEECSCLPESWSRGRRLQAALAGLLVVPFSLLATALHFTRTARGLVRRMQNKP